jgi:hypothetical protein
MQSPSVGSNGAKVREDETEVLAGSRADQTVAALARGTFLLSSTFNTLISSKTSLTQSSRQAYHSEDVFGVPFGIDGRSFLLI